MKLAVISLGASTSRNIIRESEGYFEVADHIDIREVDVEMGCNGLAVMHKGRPLPYYDCVYVRGSYKYALLQSSITSALYNKCYMPLHSSSFTLGHDKLLTLLELQNLNVPLPTTYISATTNAAKQLFNTLRYPVIIKVPRGSQGKGVMVADSVQSARSVIDVLDTFNQPYIIQEYIDTDSTDIRAIVLGGEVVACMKRKGKSSEEFRANIHQGGIGEPYALNFDAEHVAIKAAKSVKADICAVDMLEYNNKMHVIEVNLSPGLGGINKALNLNIASNISHYLYKRTRDFLDSRKDDYSDSVIKSVNSQEFVSTINVKAGIIKLPELITRLTGFTLDDEVKICASKGSLRIDRFEIEEK